MMRCPLLCRRNTKLEKGQKAKKGKMDLWWGFNNVKIKEGDEQKRAFITYVGSFEPIVMFFGMTNLPAMFQAMMNEILRDMINEGKVVAFVDDVLVGIEMEEGHNEIVEEVLKQLEENDLYVKPEKYVESKEDWILRGYYRTRWNRDRKGKGGQSVKLARTKKCKRHQKVLGSRKLLQEVYQGFCSSSKTNEYADEEGCKVAIGGRTAEGI